YAFLGAGRELETFLQAAVGLVSRDDEILLGRSTGYLPVGTLLLVQRTNVGYDKAGSLQGLLDGIPYGIPRIVKYYSHPAAGLEYPEVLLETLLHQVLVLQKTLPLGPVDDGLGSRVGPYTMPRLDEKVQISVIDVFTERRVSENVIDTVIRKVQVTRASSRDNRVRVLS